MAQAMIDLININNKVNLKNRSTQTNESELYDNLSDNKQIHFYHSKTHQDFILTFLKENTPAFTLTRSMWPIIKKNFLEIDKEFSK